MDLNNTCLHYYYRDYQLNCCLGYIANSYFNSIRVFTVVPPRIGLKTV